MYSEYVVCVMSISSLSTYLYAYSQDYTNADNPFGDQHLLDTFVWHKVHVYMFIVAVGMVGNERVVQLQYFKPQE